MPRILFICPTYGHLDYAFKAIDSFVLHSSPEDGAVLIDDASPNWPGVEKIYDTYRPFTPQRFFITSFSENGGLTRSWNMGLWHARHQGFEYAICGNSDILFSPNWHLQLVELLNKQGWRLAGPVTNCPGAPQYGSQNVKHFFPNYKVSDDKCDIAKVAACLLLNYHDSACVTHINGFFMMAKTSTWWEGAYDSENVFCPRNDFNSKGQRNPTPLMTLNEDELQRRWREKGWLIGFTPASFIFHYRAVTRGGRAATVEGAYRP